MKRKVKIKEIASLVGVSPATVSLALNNRHGVSAETKRRVLEQAKSLELEQPPALGNAFVKLILFTTTAHLENFENRKLFNISYVEISRLLQREQIEVRLVSLSDEEELLEAVLSSEAEGAMGVLLEANEVPAAFLPKLGACRLPLVLYDNELLGDHWDVVNFHNRKAVYQGMRYLEDQGHRDIVYLRNSTTINNFLVRRKSYVQYLTEHRKEGSACAEIVDVGSDPDTICESLTRYLAERPKRPDAFFLENFTISIGALRCAQKLGLSIPEDLSLLGIDALPESALQPMELTHFVIPHQERSKLVVRQFLYRLRDKDGMPPVETLVSPSFRPGQTVKIKADRSLQ